ncbi:hypothetical protein GGS23DRAFT_594536 [Durotheca rogersii]|uniref:uncharacterized protein n=1 Tax=Durotheca rogersii TaxID=419775 RepID=UPI00221ED4C7|nr:uncharacterized protein GGS23DRAFT_594536 [Durotheca rogersii]KAI5864974.1 hypothetical protein GGS23DRAFT_594536 [Durotheca rogersii]
MLSDTSPSSSGQPGCITPLGDLLGSSDHEEAALQACPVLSPGADHLSASQESPGKASSGRTMGDVGELSVAPTTHDDVSDAQLTQKSYQVGSSRAKPAALPTPLPPPDQSRGITVRDTTAVKMRSHPTTAKKAQANFIIVHTQDSASDIIEAIYKELSRARNDCALELCHSSEGPYLRIIASTEKSIAELVQAARDSADDLISDEASGASRIFQEPPAGLKNDARVFLNVGLLPSSVRPRLQPRGDAANPGSQPGFQEYVSSLTNSVYRGLKKAGRFPLLLTLRIHLGHYFLEAYPRGKEVYQYGDFHAMMKNPRVSGRLKTWIGDETTAERVLDFVRNGSNSPFQPTSNQASSPTDVLPDYLFEVHSQNFKFDVSIITTARARRHGTCQMYRVAASETDPNAAELEITNLSVGKELDWALRAIREEKHAKISQDIVQYLRSAKVHMEDLGRAHDFDVYPLVALDRRNPIAGKLKDAIMKTVYRFRWKATTYIVEIAVNHRWSDIAAMVGRAPPIIDLGVSIYGQDWDLDDQAAGNIWGEELQFLLEDGGQTTRPQGVDRVANFLHVVMDVRDTLDPFFRGHEPGIA